MDGDFYIDTTAWDIYGPKTSGAWGSGTSIIGPSGGGASTLQRVVMTSNLTLTASTVGSTYQAVPWDGSATLSGEAGEIYEFEWHGAVSTAGTGEGYSVEISGPSDMVGEIRTHLMPSGTNPAGVIANFTSGVATVTQATAVGGTPQHLWIEGTLVFTTAGTLNVKFRTESTSGSNTATLHAYTDAKLDKFV